MSAMQGVGIDIIEIERVGAVLQRRGDRFIRHVFLPGEVRYCSARRNPATHYAARFAAKEAVIKALAVKKGMTFLWRDIEVIRSEDGSPSIRLTGRALELASRRGVTRVLVSLSHSETHAVATAAAC
ncbi:MAG TPA: holo-ACP synthase [Candidatus Polarisedimenticolia bacterium]|nr:holo-ACP synthase [Candidatus Polarisedimenticolia bacterium]